MQDQFQLPAAASIGSYRMALHAGLPAFPASSATDADFRAATLMLSPRARSL